MHQILFKFFFLHSEFPNAFIRDPILLHCILSFNAIAPTMMMKVLTKINNSPKTLRSPYLCKGVFLPLKMVVKAIPLCFCFMHWEKILYSKCDASNKSNQDVLPTHLKMFERDPLISNPESRDTMNDYMVSLASRSLMFNLSSVNNRRWRALHKPQFYVNLSEQRQLQKSLKYAFSAKWERR
nr:uncharacterized protein LOC107436735 isoform X8 [Parasteatoda tepidariorum]